MTQILDKDERRAGIVEIAVVMGGICLAAFVLLAILHSVNREIAAKRHSDENTIATEPLRIGASRGNVSTIRHEDHDYVVWRYVDHIAVLHSPACHCGGGGDGAETSR